MGRCEHQRHSTFLAFLLLLIVRALCDADNSNVPQARSNSIHTALEIQQQKIFLWYASYGSNMNMQRFLCYIEGGQIEGMKKHCEGSRDKTRPSSTKWGTVPYRMFFGRNKTKMWGPGGVAFLSLHRNKKDKAYIRLFKITLQQFNDVLKQENDERYVMSSPLFTWTDMKSIKNEGYKFVTALKKGWYRTVLYLGHEQNLPVLTFTLPLLRMENFMSEKLPVCPPSKGYRDVIMKALVEEGKVSPQVASAYIKESYEKPLKGSHSNHSCCPPRCGHL